MIDRTTQGMAANRKGFSATLGRTRKARKIEAVLRDYTGESLHTKKILDIGTGSGEIASILGKEAEVTSVDSSDSRTTTENYRFVRVQDETLPFADEEFDLVISNHVVEHVGDPKSHMSEIARVLKKEGVAYVATPNRWWPWEVHYRLPLLHFLPTPAFLASLKILGIYREDVRLLSLASLRQLVASEFDAFFYSDKIARRPEEYFMSCPAWLQPVLALPPLRLYSFLLAVNPTFVAVLKRKQKSDDSLT